jgi:methionine synthase I (cobalamin-dependent)/5,10-methylenetetrahydrofolate reductase
MKPFLEALDERVLIGDGATGTMLYAKGIFLNRCFDDLNLTQPDLVAEIHQAYVRAGADIVETNTFGANRVKLATFGLEARLHAMNAQGARLARHAARESAYVAGAMGPLGIRVEPWGKTGLDEAETFFREQAQALVDGGVDLFMLETFRDVRELQAAIRAVRSVSDKPIVAQLTTGDDGNTLDGTPPEQFTPQLAELGADVIGLNCSVGPAVMLETIERMAAVTNARLATQPNAGRPRDVEGRNIYLSSPEYMASYARRFINAGVRLVGGCCGTTPDHIRHIKLAAKAITSSAAASGAASSSATASAVAAAAKATTAARLAKASTAMVVDEVKPVARSDKSRLSCQLARGKFVVSVELAAPRGFATDAIIEQARLLKIRGIDAITIPDQTGSGARMSALALAVLVEQAAGIETILQQSCRDHRLIALQSDLLGAHAMGVRNLLLVTGEPLRRSDYDDAASVLEVDSVGLTNAVTRLNQGIDIGGQAIGRPTGFHTGVMANPAAISLDDEVRRFFYKVEAGAEFAVTQPIYDVADLELFLKRTEAARVPLIVGIRPFDSLRQAEWLANEVPNIRVPDVLVERMRRAELDGRALDEGIAIAREIADAVRPMANGLQITPPTGRAALAVDVLTA